MIHNTDFYLTVMVTAGNIIMISVLDVKSRLSYTQCGK